MIILFTTVDNEAKAKELAKKIVEEKLAACVSVFPVESTYSWQGKICENEKEYMLIIKTLEEKLNQLINWLKEHHPYTVPELITIKAEAFGKYLEWMTDYLLKS